MSDKFDVQTQKLKQEKSKKENEKRNKKFSEKSENTAIFDQCHLIPECTGRCENGYCEKTKYY